MIIAPSALAQRQKKVEIAAPERVILETKDGVELRAEWYAGPAGKESPAVILVHDWDGNRQKMTRLASVLQKSSKCAVIVPDMRGHGESLVVKGSSDDIDRNRFKKNDLLTFVEDIDACRKFLQDKNNEGELNLDMLAVVASGNMSVPAADWTVSDWSWRPIGGVKQGQNVKSLILISPTKKFKSLSLTQSLKAPIYTIRDGALPLLLIWGKRSKSAKDGDSIFKSLVKSRREPEDFEDWDDRWKRQTVFKVDYDSSAQADELVADQFQNISNAVSLFIEKKISDKADEYSWQNRKIE